MAREGGSRFFLYTYVEGGWEGEGVDFFYKFIMKGGGGVGGRRRGSGLVFFVIFFFHY